MLGKLRGEGTDRRHVSAKSGFFFSPMLWQWGRTALLVCQTHSPAEKTKSRQKVKHQEKHHTGETAVYLELCFVTPHDPVYTLFIYIIAAKCVAKVKDRLFDALTGADPKAPGTWLETSTIDR